MTTLFFRSILLPCNPNLSRARLVDLLFAKKFLSVSSSDKDIELPCSVAVSPNSLLVAPVVEPLLLLLFVSWGSELELRRFVIINLSLTRTIDIKVEFYKLSKLPIKFIYNLLLKIDYWFLLAT